MEDWCGGTPDSWSKWSDKRVQLRAEKTLIERPLQLLYPLELTCNRPERRRGETLRADAREFQPRRAAADERLPRKFPQGIHPCRYKIMTRS